MERDDSALDAARASTGDANDARDVDDGVVDDSEAVAGVCAAQDEEQQSTEDAAGKAAPSLAADASASTAATVAQESSTDNANILENGDKKDVSSKKLVAELQCILCHEVLCKPITTVCGHSFCRVCLMDFLLSKEVHETQCPICRSEVLFAPRDDATPPFYINVTLWNVIQLLLPGKHQLHEEEEEYTLKHEQFSTKWRIAALQHSSRHDRHGDDDSEMSSNDEMMHTGWQTSSNRRARERYPQLRTENFADGELELVRNVVLDRDDVNIDGYEGMRVGLGVMEFPSRFQLYNEHQECSIAVLKFEEDEDMEDGMPFFMNDNGDDDHFVVSDYYNEVTLKVLNERGNVVLERTRGAQQGTIVFPSLRLDVPAGVYRFEFTDDLYGLRLMIKTELRGPRDERDAPLIELEDEQSRSFVLNEAGERGRRQRARWDRRRSGADEEDDDDEEEDDEDNASDDSFIATDDEVQEEVNEAHRLSGEEEGGEGFWSFTDDDDEEAAMERAAAARQGRRRRRRRQERRPSQQLSEVSESEPVQPSRGPRRRWVRNHVVDESEDDGHHSPPIVQEEHGSDDDNGQTLNEIHEHAHSSSESESIPIQRRGQKRGLAIEESDQDEHDDGDEVVPMSTARLRVVRPRVLHDDDDSDEEEDVNDLDPMEDQLEQMHPSLEDEEMEELHEAQDADAEEEELEERSDGDAEEEEAEWNSASGGYGTDDMLDPGTGDGDFSDGDGVEEQGEDDEAEFSDY
ncbi:hypothetical protein Poli38472_008257 [Pythium oligandrum]|uniref:RING-type domain-containing protein n=1 Tax=Pythium oligandrum TaxID=41045 RepID=A0A8K1CN26_PYTOL|nr:hypothetical protein Poli38472_008257 [Pythium oligandrum]|eukprot:TMW65615.1 hypothetical protein Poli38472_008257 [Pythium oligandrum]